MCTGLGSSLTLSKCLTTGAAVANVIFIIVTREDFDTCPQGPACWLTREGNWGSVGTILLGFWPLCVWGSQDPEATVLAGAHFGRVVGPGCTVG